MQNWPEGDPLKFKQSHSVRCLAKSTCKRRGRKIGAWDLIKSSILSLNLSTVSTMCVCVHVSAILCICYQSPWVVKTLSLCIHNILRMRYFKQSGTYPLFRVSFSFHSTTSCYYTRRTFCFVMDIAAVAAAAAAVVYLHRTSTEIRHLRVAKFL